MIQELSKGLSSAFDQANKIGLKAFKQLREASFKTAMKAKFAIRDASLEAAMNIGATMEALSGVQAKPVPVRVRANQDRQKPS